MNKARSALILLVVASIFGVSSIVNAQEGTISVPDEEFLSVIMRLFEFDNIPQEFTPAVEQYIREKLEWEREKIQITRRVIARTNTSSIVGFIVAHIAVLGGFIAAFLEFTHARKLRKRGAEIEQQELRIGIEGIAVKTSMYGLMFLMIACGFYLLYLKFVYPIMVIGP